MNKQLLAIIFLSLPCMLKAQYYYNDIVAPQQSRQQFKNYIANSIKKVSAKSFDFNGAQVEDFVLETSVDADKGSTTTVSNTESVKGITVNTYKNNRLQQTDDSSANVRTISKYSYDAQGRVQKIESTTSDAFMEARSTEVHEWYYGANNQPSYMLRIKDGSDTTRIFFVMDDEGNVSEEHWKRNNKFVEDYYYFYVKKQLTDVARFNLTANRYLPDMVFEYDQHNRITKFLQMPDGQRDRYLVWLYEYNDLGLKTKDNLFDKHNKLIGKVEYSYK
jgi:hypothetical protein